MYIYIKLICYGKMEPLLIYMHVQYLQQHTEKAYYVETLRTCDLLYMHSKKQDNNSAKCFKCSSQIHKITEHGMFEKL